MLIATVMDTREVAYAAIIRSKRYSGVANVDHLDVRNQGALSLLECIEAVCRSI